MTNACIASCANVSLLNNHLKFKRGDVMNSYRGTICLMHESLNVVTELTCRCHVERLYLVVSEYTGRIECLVFNVTYYTRKYDNHHAIRAVNDSAVDVASFASCRFACFASLYRFVYVNNMPINSRNKGSRVNDCFL